MNNQYDIIPFPDKIRTLFVLESPHEDEIKAGYPAAGQTGRNMSRVILCNDQIPFGKLLFDKHDSVSEYGIFNSCHFPLGLPKKLEGKELEIAGLKCIHQSKDRFDNYKRLDQFLGTIDDLDNIIRFKDRFEKVLKNSSSIETIVFCGFIAQSIFLKLYPAVKIPLYNTPTKLKSKKMHFVNHPSEIESKWVYELVKE